MKAALLGTIKRRVRCFFIGHRYSALMNGRCLYFCAHGCGREYLKGYMNARELEQAFAELEPLDPEERERLAWEDDLARDSGDPYWGTFLEEAPALTLLRRFVRRLPGGRLL